VSAELNPYTRYELKGYALFQAAPGSEECTEGEAVLLAVIDHPTGPLLEAFWVARAWFHERYGLRPDPPSFFDNMWEKYS
jgi:hypothetical protein